MESIHPINEEERLSELRRYSVLDTSPEGAFDDLTKLAAYVCGAPISLVSLVDAERIWFKSKVGLAAREIPRIDGFCASAILDDRPLVVPDAAANERLASHPLVTSPPNLRFYAGAPLITPRGHRIGTLCVIDVVARELNAEQIDALESLARTVVAQLELRLAVRNSGTTSRALRELQASTETEVKNRTEQLASTNESLRRLSGRLLNAQDDERRRIARELHDSTGQLLAALCMTIDQMAKDASPANSERLRECRKMAAAAADEIRSLSYLLHPPLIELAGLTSTVADYVEGFAKRSGIRIGVDISQDIGRLDENREIALFRVIQESLGNIHRHSGSTVANIKIFDAGKDVVLEIRDQGCGLPAAAGETQQLGVGIRSMEERLRQFGGSLAIESNGSGTKVRAILPRHASPDSTSAQPGLHSAKAAAAGSDANSEHAQARRPAEMHR
ncbi:MAG: GAF domain-containing sensor histidine kinase [Candidatus Acidiferrales bacterium]